MLGIHKHLNMKKDHSLQSIKKNVPILFLNLASGSSHSVRDYLRKVSWSHFTEQKELFSSLAPIYFHCSIWKKKKNSQTSVDGKKGQRGF